MWKRLARYHADLNRRGAQSQDAARYGEVNEIAFPWFLPLGAMVLGAIAAEAFAKPIAQKVQIVLALLLGLPTILGMTYATCTYLFAAVRADARRRRARISTRR